MPAWIHDRADHIRRKNPGMPKSMSFALATQQAHATGHTPKGYGTAAGKREAKRKYDEPKREYVQTADPSQKSKTAMRLVFWKGFADEIEKIAMGAMPQMPKLKMPVKTPAQTSIPRNISTPPAMNDAMSSTKTMQPPPVTA